MQAKSYFDIVHTCELVSVSDTDSFIETYMDDTHMYRCIWFGSNFRSVPSTIERVSL